MGKLASNKDKIVQDSKIIPMALLSCSNSFSGFKKWCFRNENIFKNSLYLITEF